MLEQHIASAARKALDRRAHGLLDAERIEQLAVQAAERQLAELADLPGLYYLTLEEWVHEWLFPVYRRSVLWARPRVVPGRSRPGVRCQKAEVDVRVKRSILPGNDGNAETPRDLDPAFRRRLTRVGRRSYCRR